MKKCFMKAVKIIAAAAVALVFASCTTPPAPNKVDYQVRGIDRSPENSVVFCLYFEGNFKMTFVQSDPEFGEDTQDLLTDYLVSAPCEPGSYYHCTFINGIGHLGGKSYWRQKVPENFYGLDIKLPSKPGLYYLGFFDGNKSLEEGTYRDFTDDPYTCFNFHVPRDQLKREKMVLERVKRNYKGTAWEVYVSEKLEEIEEMINKK